MFSQARPRPPVLLTTSLHNLNAWQATRIVVDTWFCLAFRVGIKEVLAVLPALQMLIIVTTDF